MVQFTYFPLSYLTVASKGSVTVCADAILQPCSFEQDERIEAHAC